MTGEEEKQPKERNNRSLAAAIQAACTSLHTGSALQEKNTMQPQKQNMPPEEHEAIQYYVLEGLFPTTHVFALNQPLGTFLHLYWEEQLPYPRILGEQQLTERERDLLRPRLSQYPQFAVICQDNCVGLPDSMSSCQALPADHLCHITWRALRVTFFRSSPYFFARSLSLSPR